ncbi:hypothetical protein [Halalkalibacillus halophilus]|uniref:hypothetical protein n=1 Tax=Halalkalibacillus halophilus TaxID=392827 RepID=UPI0004130E08|nr:hypothetical protein [Halalkalibacillus halophilus]
MTKNSEKRINFFTYLLNIIVKPTSNIRSNTYVFWLWNVIFTAITVPVFVMIVLQINFSASTDEIGLASVLGLIIFLFIMNVSVYALPLLLINMLLIYLINKKASNVPNSLSKVFSDHTNVFTQSLILFFLGVASFTNGHALINNYELFAFAGVLLFLSSLVVYLAGSLGMMRFYLRDNKENKMKISFIYIVILVTLITIYTCGVYIIVPLY